MAGLSRLNELLRTSQRKTAELLYVADMQRAFGAWQDRQPDHVRHILLQQQPAPGDPDLPGLNGSCWNRSRWSPVRWFCTATKGP